MIWEKVPSDQKPINVGGLSSKPSKSINIALSISCFVIEDSCALREARAFASLRSMFTVCISPTSRLMIELLEFDLTERLPVRLN